MRTTYRSYTGNHRSVQRNRVLIRVLAVLLVLLGVLYAQRTGWIDMPFLEAFSGAGHPADPAVASGKTPSGRLHGKGKRIPCVHNRSKPGSDAGTYPDTGAHTAPCGNRPSQTRPCPRSIPPVCVQDKNGYRHLRHNLQGWRENDLGGPSGR